MHIDHTMALDQHSIDRDAITSTDEFMSSPDDFEVVQKIGRGRRAEVFHAVRMSDRRVFAIKIFKPPNDQRARNEMEILQELRGCPNIVSLITAVEDQQGGRISLVFELVQSMDYHSVFPKLKPGEIRHYFRQLIAALSYAHDKAIMHRNVRPLNIIIDPVKKQLKLSGWGSSTRFAPGTTYEVTVGTAFKAPELLLSFGEYDQSIDMWGVGDMLASVVFKKDPFFHGIGILDQLDRIAQVLGTGGLLNWVEKYDMEAMDVEEVAVHERRRWSSLVNEENRDRADHDALSLLDGILRWDHEDRLTAQAALMHPFFSSSSSEEG
ncbi:kinase-like domain-containing protein [Plectosphaerella cucumerina]|uniref:non-specific serine/threonine protein kinase n=1 Tax=Plectosphaerella cucumerina TaxID=40658 RepID=A0A8K0TS00_9PEZI|nr:kinase-like domain-containing protein [Plectosphaerella cucumerina]